MSDTIERDGSRSVFVMRDQAKGYIASSDQKQRSLGAALRPGTNKRLAAERGQQ